MIAFLFNSIATKSLIALMLEVKVLPSLLVVVLTPFLGYGILANQVSFFFCTTCRSTFKHPLELGKPRLYVLKYLFLCIYCPSNCDLTSHIDIYSFIYHLTGTSAPVYQFSSHSFWISTCKWHEKSRFHLLSASYDGKVMLWDLRTAVSTTLFTSLLLVVRLFISTYIFCSWVK